MRGLETQIGATNMSHDISIGDFDRNYTSNVSKVFYDHLEGGLHSFYGKTGKEAAPMLAEMWRKLNDTRHKMYVDGACGEPAMQAKYDAKNGWGSLVGALIFLGEFSAACAMFPRHKIHLSA